MLQTDLVSPGCHGKTWHSSNVHTHQGNLGMKEQSSESVFNVKLKKFFFFLSFCLFVFFTTFGFLKHSIISK